MRLKIKLMIIVLICGLSSCSESNKKLNENIKIVSSSEIQSINELVNYSDFKNKVLYLNFWEVDSDPSILELSYYGDLKKRFRNENIEFLFLTSSYHNSKKRKWKNVLKQNNLEGYHIQNIDLIIDILDSRMTKHDTFPIFMLFDKQGRIDEIKAAKPSNKEELYKQIEALL